DRNTNSSLRNHKMKKNLFVVLIIVSFLALSGGESAVSAQSTPSTESQPAPAQTPSPAPQTAEPNQEPQAGAQTPTAPLSSKPAIRSLSQPGESRRKPRKFRFRFQSWEPT